LIWKKTKGAAALEYILVTTFASVLTIGALSLVGKTIQDKITELSQSLEEQQGQEWNR